MTNKSKAEKADPLKDILAGLGTRLLLLIFFVAILRSTINEVVLTVSGTGMITSGTFLLLVAIPFAVVILSEAFFNSKGWGWIGWGGITIVFLLIIAMIALIASDFIATKNIADAKAAEATRVAKITAERKEQEIQSELKRLNALPICEYQIVSRRIYSLERSNEIVGEIHGESRGSIGGVFVLGFGSVYGSSSGKIDGAISERTMYYFYTNTPDGRGYILDSIPATIGIYENDLVPPGLYTLKRTNAYDECVGGEINNISMNYNPGVVFETESSFGKVEHGWLYDAAGYGYKDFMVYCLGAKPPVRFPSESNCFSFSPTQQLVVPTGTIRREFKPN
jgi:hypothetical protein